MLPAMRNLCFAPLLLAALAGIARAEPPVVGRAAGASPLQDDAALYDVQFVGERCGWCVGDHGAIWTTSDAGATWRHVPSPVRATLRSVCFLTDRIGWVAGGGVRPFTRQPYGVLLFTDDGGASWRVHTEDAWPNLQYVRFFGLERGVAVGEARDGFPTGVLVTQDGGQSWQPVPGELRPGWRTADFPRPEIGTVGGLRGGLALVGGNQILATQAGGLDRKTVRQIRLSVEDTGWLVGDGGLVRRTENGGVSWSEPPGPLPAELAECIDFHAVAVRGPKIWMAGSPGGVVWHSPDDGRTWMPFRTGQTVPIHDLEFPTDETGWAVGEMGLLLATTDGGQTWKAIRGGDRRAALLACVPRAEAISFSLLTKLAGDEGYRCVVRLPSRGDVRPGGVEAPAFDLRLRQAVGSVGGSAAESSWRFALERPEIERDMERLVDDWNNQAEGQFPQVFLGSLVRSLRTWRPSVVVVDMAGEDDAVGRLLFDAIQQAARQAADPTRFTVQQQLGGIGPHAVSRVYFRQPPGSIGQAHLDPHEYLPRLGTSPHTAAVTAAAHLFSSPARAAAEREAYRLVYHAAEDAAAETATDFFTGLHIEPGTAARRALWLVDPVDHERRQKLFERQRNFRAYAERAFDDPRLAAQVIGQLRTMTEGLSDREAALELAQLVRDYRRRSQWDLAEATAVELIERFPNEPAAIDAMRWRFHTWSGSVSTWQRARQSRVQRATLAVDTSDVRARIEQAMQAAQNPTIVQAGFAFDPASDPVQLLVTEGRLRVGAKDDWRSGAVRNWHDQAVRMAALLRQVAPSLYTAPEMQFPLAALLRQRQSFELSDRVYRKFAAGPVDDPWTRAATAEQWLHAPGGEPPKAVADALPVRERPLLDGVLSDACWQAARILPLQDMARDAELSTDTAAKGSGGLVMLAHDAEFLYIAASLPRMAGVSYDEVQLPGRTHDADTSGHDRITLHLDLDRDYATWYTLEIDQRGWTRDACAGDDAFNPKWYVAAGDDGKRWQVEAAVPLSELTPQPPTAGTFWAIAITRTVPGVALESWTRPMGTEPRPEGFGLLHFR
jgi:photosystem II stability/assembly factor-like uncharacterized protein